MPPKIETGTQRDTCTLMFIAALFTIAKTWKPPKCPLRMKGKQKMVQWNTTQLQKEENSDTYCNMNETWGCYAERNKPVTKGQISWFHLYHLYELLSQIHIKKKLNGDCQGLGKEGMDSCSIQNWAEPCIALPRKEVFLCPPFLIC